MKKMMATLAITFVLLLVATATASAKEYEVEAGDSLWSIAESNDTTVEELVEINELDSTTIHPKQTINIHTIYEVEKGDTLSSIAKDFDVKKKDIKKWNDLDSSELSVGDELTIKSVKKDKKKAKEDTSAKAEESKKEEPVQEENDQPSGQTLTVSATAYTAQCAGCSGITATGVDLNNDPHAKVIAVDPNVIPLGTKVHVEGYGEAIAADTGGAIKGNKIDIHVPTKDEAFQWGRRSVQVTILN
ncbi:MAG TPA: LysM peptidoglycan-binding domain-containing protein [Bacillota bacterium]|nr:LysM peptidoglycan-binding domain-containing protein [Bacillota bacterium]